MILNLPEIESYLEQQLNINNITVIDDGHFHTHHQSFQQNKAYLRIQLPKQNTPRLALHRKIMSLTKTICNRPIHAIQIESI